MSDEGFPCGHRDPGVQGLQALGKTGRFCGTCGCPETIPDGTVWSTVLGRAVAIKDKGR